MKRLIGSEGYDVLTYHCIAVAHTARSSSFPRSSVGTHWMPTLLRRLRHMTVGSLICKGCDAERRGTAFPTRSVGKRDQKEPDFLGGRSIRSVRPPRARASKHE